MIPDFKSNGKWVTATRDELGKHLSTYSCNKFFDVKKRCNPKNHVVGNKYYSYIGCTRCDVFLDYQDFVDWHICQIGYGMGYALDKDILFKGNKVYSKDTVVLVPQALNNFLTDRRNDRGDLPQGVMWSSTKEKYQVQLSTNGRQRTLGHFSCLNSAMQCYAEAKTAAGRRWGQRLLSGEYIVDDRVIEAMLTYEFLY